MPSSRQIRVEPPVSTYGPGSSDTADMQILYPGSPVYNGDLTDEWVDENFNTLSQAGVITDEGHTFGEVKRDYQDAPNLEEVETGGGGLPGSPWAPNVATPETGMNPADIPAAGAEVTQRIPHGGGYGVGDGLVSPSTTSARIARQRIGNLILGKSSTEG